MIRYKIEADLFQFDNNHRLGKNCFKYLKYYHPFPSLLRKLKQQRLLG